MFDLNFSMSSEILVFTKMLFSKDDSTALIDLMQEQNKEKPEVAIGVSFAVTILENFTIH